MRETQEYRIGTGASLMLMIVVVLMLTVMGLLALSSAQAGKRQTDQNVRTVTDTYAAYAACERALAQIDEARGEAATKEEWKDRVLAIQTDPVDAQRQLRAVICVTEEKGLRVDAWRIERTDTWETDDSLTLFDGSAF